MQTELKKKKTYSPPRIRPHGSVAQITQQGTGTSGGQVFGGCLIDGGIQVPNAS